MVMVNKTMIDGKQGLAAFLFICNDDPYNQYYNDLHIHNYECYALESLKLVWLMMLKVKKNTL